MEHNVCFSAKSILFLKHLSNVFLVVYAVSAFLSIAASHQDSMKSNVPHDIP